ncbi:MAG: COX15/CtaA family protein [Hyphomicrobiales bacterium]|jgi:heme a synthase|nr:COX15/CtaA family protein [Hyphomicrobiales bacterium]
MLTKQYKIRYRNLLLDPVFFWFFCSISLLIILICVGGITRLTESGLSITEWQPIMGVLFPLTDLSWQMEFDKYKQIPEFLLLNNDMSLSEFKYIYFWEWFHRMIARGFGFLFLFPFLYFLYKRSFKEKEYILLPFVLVLIIIQAIVGWYMVQSGLSENVNVSQYRLALHLSIAFVILGLLLYLLLHRVNILINENRHKDIFLRVTSYIILLFVFLQIVLGAFLSGIRAGLAYNTWPLMDGKVIPDNLFILPTWYKNFFENPLTVQFDHRILAYILLFTVLMQWTYLYKNYKNTIYLKSSTYLILALFFQIILGVLALLNQVPIYLGILHQLGAVLLFIAALHHFYITEQTSK